MLSDAEIVAIKQLYPGLRPVQKEGKDFIGGTLHFIASYDSALDALTINPSQATIKNDSFITSGKKR